jgi:para-nitrobenzyl esterase
MQKQHAAGAKPADYAGMDARMKDLTMAFPTRIALTMLGLAALSAHALANDTRVTVADGAIQGTEAEGIIAFKGIPFAAPPVGDLRWRAPQPPKRWAGVLDASQYAHDCMQIPFNGDAAPLGTAPSEDCLYANVWKPAKAAGKLPVLVWIYGGGFLNGGASPPTYAGTELARQGILVFSFNYRLARFGTFAHPQLTKADADKGQLANYGYMDQLAALKWVQANIAAFGGDPKNVTIMGESAGGMSVNTLVTSPLTDGLFSRAVILSGGDGAALAGGDLKSAEAIGATFAAAKGVPADAPDALTKLRALPAGTVMDGLNLMTLFRPQPGPRTFSSPIQDGKLAVDAASAYASGKFHRVPTIIGATSDDIGGKTGTMIAGAYKIAGLTTDRGVPTYYYRFSYVADSARSANGVGAGHATDIPFFFHTEAIKYGDATTQKDRTVGRIASAYLVNFVKTGNPNGAGLPLWPKFSRPGAEMLDLSEQGMATVGKDPWADTLAAALDHQPAATAP